MAYLKLTLTQTPEGLIIKADDLKEFAEYVQEKGGGYIPLCDLLEDSGYLGNGWSDLHDRIALFSGDAVGYMIDFDDEGNIKDHGEEDQIYYYPHHMVRFYTEDILRDGEVFFPLAN